MTLRQNVDIERLEGFRTFLRDNPEKGKLSLEARAIYEGQAGRSTVHVGPFAIDDNRVDRETRHYTFPFGAWREVEELTGMAGPTDRMEPVEMALAATAACLVNAISYNAARLGIAADGLEVTVKSTVDPRVLFAIKGPEAHKACLGGLQYEVKVTGDVSDEEIETIRRLCEHSPVHGMIAEAISISGKVTRAESALASSTVGAAVE
ncbi:MAG: OsmC family protein [Gemmatimonadota bacterium]